jgi:hypothetical protein
MTVVSVDSLIGVSRPVTPSRYRPAPEAAASFAVFHTLIFAGSCCRVAYRGRKPDVTRGPS